MNLETFKKEFYIENEYDINTLVDCLVYGSVYNNQELR